MSTSKLDDVKYKSLIGQIWVFVVLKAVFFVKNESLFSP